VPLIATALQVLIGPRATEVLPNLCDIFLGDLRCPELYRKPCSHCVTARQLSGQPVAVHHWEETGSSTLVTHWRRLLSYQSPSRYLFGYSSLLSFTSRSKPSITFTTDNHYDPYVERGLTGSMTAGKDHEEHYSVF